MENERTDEILNEPNAGIINKIKDTREVAPPITYKIAPGFDQKFEDDFRELFTPRLKKDEDFGSELWQALANVDWIHQDDPEETRVHRGFRSAGSMIASMLGIGDYIDWYCSGPYETVSEYIAEKMASKGWRYELDGDGSDINKGRLSFTDGSLYEGEIENGKPNGKGKMKKRNGDVYEGDFVDGQYNGKGKYTDRWGNIYEGDYLKGKQTGKGKYTWAESGQVYEGDWVDGGFHGTGKFIYIDKRVYEGDWTNDCLTGKGKMTWPDGDIYEGDFVDGIYHGKGKRTWPDGSVKEGEWKNGEFIEKEE